MATPSSSSSFALPLHRLSIGDTVRIYWDGDRKWYPAEITEAEGDHRCEVLYSDGEREWVSLDKVKFYRSGRPRSKEGGDGDGGSSIEEIKTMLFDIEDRLAHEAVYTEDNNWWKAWHDGVTNFVAANDIKGLMGAMLSLALQLKPSITSSWWAKHDESWKKRLEITVTVQYATLLVKELRNNAIDWSAVRKLFSGDSDGGCSQQEHIGPDSGNDEMVDKSLRQSRPSHDVKTRSKSLRKCSKLSVSTVPLSLTGNLPAVGNRRSNRLKKSMVEMLRSENSTRNKKDPESPLCSEEGVAGCRRSNRLKKSTIEMLSSKNTPRNEKDHESPLCSEEGDKQEPQLQRPNRSTKRKYIDRAIGEQTSTEGENLAHNKKELHDSNTVEINNGDSGHMNEPFNERKSGDSSKPSRSSRLDGPPCSICQIATCSTYLVQCKNSHCFSAFHTFCLNPPLQTVEQKLFCPYCDKNSFTSKLVNNNSENTTKKIGKIVGHKQVTLENQRAVCYDEFLIKWESLSHHHDSWVPREWLYLTDRVRLHSYLRKGLILSDSVDQRKPEWFIMDRVIASREKYNLGKACEKRKVCTANQGAGDFEFLVKWKGLDYCESTWESSCTEELLSQVGSLLLRHQRAEEKTKTVCALPGSGPPYKTPHDLYGDILYDYQLQGLNWILSNFSARRNVILADEMGLGKTVQVVSFINCMKQEKLSVDPVLIIAPKSILFQWEKEFCQWAKDLNVIIYQGDKQSRHCIKMHEMYSSEKDVLFDALVTNYEMAILDSSTLKKFKWSAIIVDEAHKIKRLDCKLASYLNRYKSDFRLLLTGTPLQNTLLELFSLLHFIDPKQFSDPVAEAESYKSIKSHGRTDTEKKISEIHAILRPLMLRRMKSDVLRGSIPVKKWIEVPCALTDSQRELYIDILEKNHDKLNKEIYSGKKIVLNFILMELRKCCNHPYLFPGQEVHLSSQDAIFKTLVQTSGTLQLLEKLLPKFKERGNRVLLFSQMTRMLDILEDFLTSLQLPYFRLDGSTSMAIRQQQMKDFNSPESQIFVFLISTRAGGVGMDLPTADRVIIYDPDFNPFMDLQAQSRAHRIGQTRPVVVYQLITKCSVEEKILEKSKQKLAVENLVMNPKKQLNQTELHSILLHGARTILDRKNFKAMSITYDENAIDTLLKLDPVLGEKCEDEDNGYLGSIHSFMPGEKVSNSDDEWEDVLGPVKEENEEDLGKGKRRKKSVNYEGDECEDSDDGYAPEVSSSSSESSDSESEVEDGVFSLK